ncbi:GGDEF domain-containing protein [Conexibacter sp. CPCC 206217]|uniref:GGDEF domain-containing protein n=1 Tax=Conexibacter sp. CPCC 206217 TaxID=3064574 RepID=UPI00272466FE|nr:GGDEF domain-containing protein [Conexibacter sp. CPCC 206217]MDO8211661.1 GGDEF domain-containing protein [Conexibacter sp. CPCC 206217]
MQNEEQTARVSGRRLAPFALCGIVTFALIPITGETNVDWVEVLLAFALTVSLGIAALLAPQLTGGRFAGIAALTALVAIALLRDGTGGARGGYGVVVIVPVLWVALYGSRRQLWQVLVVVTLVLAVPLVVLGVPDYPSTGWRSMPLLVLSCALVGFVVQELLARERAIGERLQAAHSELQRLAETDPLTSLPNRRALEAAHVREIAAAQRSGRPLTLALIDLDRFKDYNDAHGHPAGDALLRAVSIEWSQRIRTTDMLARWGGEEFCLLLPGTDTAGAQLLIDGLRACVPARQTFSAGVIAWRPGTTGEQLIAGADEALYRAKRDGRDRTVVALGAAPEARRARRAHDAPAPAATS